MNTAPTNLPVPSNTPPSSAPTQTVRDILSIFFYKKRVFVATLLGVLGVTLAFAFLSPPRYETSADLLVKPALTRPFMISPEGGGFFASDVTLKDLNTIIFLLQSSEHLAQVAKRLGVANGDDPAAIQRAVAELKGRLKAEPLTESNVVRVTLKGGDPQETQRVLQTIVNTFVDYYIEINRVSGGIEFFRNQTEFLQRRLAQLNRELEQVVAQTGVVDPAVQRQTLLQLLRDLEQERMKMLSNLEELRAKTHAFSEALTRFEKNGGRTLVGLPKTTIYEYPALIEMEKSLAQLTINLQRARNDYQPGSKPVQDAEAQYANMRNQIRQYLKQIIEDLKVETQSGQAALEALQARIDDLNDKAVQLTGRSLAYEQLQLERELTSKQYGLYVDKQEEARIRQAKDDARFANVSIAAQPQLPVSPVFPRPGLMLTLALIVGPFVAAGVAAAAYLAEQRIYTPTDAAPYAPLLGALDAPPPGHPWQSAFAQTIPHASGRAS